MPGPIKLNTMSQHAAAELCDINDSPCPRVAVNPGVASMLLRRGYVTCIQLPSPYKTHNGKHIEHLQITDKGRATLVIVSLNPR